MKRILSLFILIMSLVCINGCRCDKGVDFAYFKDKINDLEGYRYYVVSQEIYNNELLLYKKDKNVYFNDDKKRILITTKEISDIESENLYDSKEEEYYSHGNNFYYKEDGSWKIKENETKEELGFNLNKSWFKNYKIKEEKGNKYFVGNIKNESLVDFLGFEVSDARDMIMNIEISSSNKVKNISLTYITGNLNKVIVSLKIEYSQVITFNLPVVA